jgi:hypothetical protein
LFNASAPRSVQATGEILENVIRDRDLEWLKQSALLASSLRKNGKGLIKVPWTVEARF